MINIILFSVSKDKLINVYGGKLYYNVDSVNEITNTKYDFLKVNFLDIEAKILVFEDTYEIIKRSVSIFRNCGQRSELDNLVCWLKNNIGNTLYTTHQKFYL